MRHTFLSYCREDVDFVRNVDARIREAGFPTLLDTSLRAGDEWRTEIDAGIREALAVVVIMSPSALMSAYVNYEWAFAIGSEIPIVPILKKIEPADLHPRLNAFSWLDFSNDADPPWERLIVSLRDLADAQRESTVWIPRNTPPALRYLARSLDSIDAGQRATAINSLKQMSDPAAIQVLAEAVRHPFQDVRFAAAFELAEKYQDPKAIPVLVEALRCRDERIERWIFNGIGAPAVPALIEVLNDEQFTPREIALLSLGHIRGPDAVQALLVHLHDADPAIRRAAACGLGSPEDSVALSALREAMHDSDPRVRDGVAIGLGYCGAQSVPDLLELLNDADMNVRHRVVCVLGDACALRPVPASMEPHVPRLIDALLDVLDDEYDQVRIFAAETLGKLCDARSIPGLITALGQPGTSVWAISEALLAHGESGLPRLREALNDPNDDVRCAVVKVIAKLGDPDDAPRLAQMMRDANPDLRLDTIEAITSKQYKSEVILQALIERLHDTEEDICLAAIRRFHEIRDPKAVSHLIECLQVEGLASSAASVLQSFGTREARNAVNAWRNHTGE